MTDDAFPDALPNQSRLHWYVLERVLGQGGFGITYLARDTNLGRQVAIKEYLPGEVAQRRPDGTVRPRSETQAERYRWGLERFVGEAQILAQFDHPNIVRVHAVFEANDTAYMVMRFEEGDNLGQLLEQRGSLPENTLLQILLPILDGLQLVHAAKFIHRDIKPENIHIRRDGSPVLLDFGSARQSLNRTHTMTILVARGYAPLEQYYGDADAQGPWTDIYSLAATCYRAIAGNAPADALERIKGVLGSVREVLKPAMEVGRGRYSTRLLKAIDHGLELSEKDRPQSIAEWRREIVAAALVDESASRIGDADNGDSGRRAAPIAAAQPQPSKGQDQSLGWKQHSAQVIWASAGAGVAAVAIAIFVGMQSQTNLDTQQKQDQQRPPAQKAQIANPLEDARKRDESLLRRDPETPPRVAQQEAQQEAQQPPLLVRQAEPVSPTAPGSRQTDKRKAVNVDVPRVNDKGKAPGKAANTPSEKPPTPTREPAKAEITQIAATPPLVAKLEAASKAPTVDVPVKPSAAELLDKAEAALNHGDYGNAFPVIKRYASGGDSRAQTLMGSLYENGLGMPRNAVDAYMWYSLAFRSGSAAARGMKERAAGKLQPAEIRQADRAIEKWRPSGEESNSGTR